LQSKFSAAYYSICLQWRFPDWC